MKWSSWTIGFSDLTEEEREVIEAKLEALKKDLDKAGITVDAITSDGGEAA